MVAWVLQQSAKYGLLRSGKPHFAVRPLKRGQGVARVTTILYL